MIHVLLADDQALLRGTFRLLLDSAPDITVVGEAATGIEAVAQARAHTPDLILTDREREVTTLVGTGLSNDEIAQRLYITPATAKTHVSRAMMKAGARDRAQLVVFAYETGLVRQSATHDRPARPAP